MKGLPFIFAAFTTAASIAFQIALATGQLQTYAWLTRYLWTVAVTLCCVWLALTIANRYSKQEAGNSAQPPQSLQAPSPSTEPILRPAPQTNIKCVEIRSVKLRSVGDGLTISPITVGELHASIICFRNEPIAGEKCEQPDLRAHIVFKDGRGQEITDAPNGLWLDEHSAYTPFTVGKKNCLVLLLLTKGDTVRKVWKEDYRDRENWMGGVSYRTRNDVILDRIATIDVSLLRAGGTCVMQISLDARQADIDHLPELSIRQA